MAQVAVGASSPCCGSLAAAAGNKSDEQLVGSCGTCGKSFAVPNPNYEAPMTSAAAVGQYDFKITNADGTVGTITVTGYHLHSQIENVQGLVKDAVPATPDDPDPRVTVPANLPPDNPDVPPPTSGGSVGQ